MIARARTIFRGGRLASRLASGLVLVVAAGCASTERGHSMSVHRDVAVQRTVPAALAREDGALIVDASDLFAEIEGAGVAATTAAEPAKGATAAAERQVADAAGADHPSPRRGLTARQKRRFLVLGLLSSRKN